jgi:hypothetical protein
MAMEPLCTRPKIADQASAVVSRQIDYWDFEAAITDELKKDPLVDELLDLILHEPAYGGRFSGTSERDHAKHWSECTR